MIVETSKFSKNKTCSQFFFRREELSLHYNIRSSVIIFDPFYRHHHSTRTTTTTRQMSRFHVVFFFASIASLLIPSAKAERRCTSVMMTTTTPFSCSEQALFGTSHTEDCLFGSTASVFHVPLEDDKSLDVVEEVKKTTFTRANKNDGPTENGRTSNKALFGLPKPAFRG